MAYVNVREWSVEQVTDWMKGLDSNITRYITTFLNNGIDGHQLLNLRVDDLEHFGVQLQGHQELILEAVELLRNFHFELDRENVQTLALRLVCAARSISRDLQLRDINAQKVPTQTMSDVHSLVAIVKPLVQWLDRRPFSLEREYNNLSTEILQYSYIMVHHTHRDTFAEKPLVSIIELCDKLMKIGNHIVQEVSDPLILQPATLDLANLKKKEQELGFYILASNTAVYQVGEIAQGSPAHINNKIEVGDEIVQVNYQTIVGWQRKSVLRLVQVSSPDIVLTLKKRPRHTKIYGQIYMQPYRLPSKKRDTSAAHAHWNWTFDSIPSPRLFNAPKPVNSQLTPHQTSNNKAAAVAPVTGLDEEPSDNDDSDSGTSVADDGTKMADGAQSGPVGRLYPVKPRVLLQRRNTISGSTLSFARPTDLIAQFYHELKKQASSNNSSATNIRLERAKFNENSIHIRDKSVSCSHVLDSSRPTTVIGVVPPPADRRRHKRHQPSAKAANSDALVPKVSALSVIALNHPNSDSDIDFMDAGVDCTDRSGMGGAAVRPTDTVLGDVHVTTIIRQFEDGVKAMAPEVLPRRVPVATVEGAAVATRRPPEVPHKPKVYPRTFTKNRSHFDRCDSLCAVASLSEERLYNITKTDDIVKSNVPPKPPPRIANKPPAKLPLHKTSDTLPQKPLHNLKSHDSQLNYNRPDVVPIVGVTSGDYDHFRCDATTASSPIAAKQQQPSVTGGVGGLSDKHKISSSSTNNLVAMIYPMCKGKGKKKSSLLARRRNVGVCDVSPGDAQGVLYQRLRHKRTQNVHWERRWFVLASSCLYGFKGKESTKADCFIHLSGFTVTIANEVKSRSNAFKVYHTGTVFYFSADNSESQSSWIDVIASATLSSDTCKPHADHSFYSETDEDEEDDTKMALDRCDGGQRKFNSLKKFARKRGDNVTPSGSTSLDRKWFFNKTMGGKSATPVKTDQFRSYRKISASTTTGNFTSHIPNFAQNDSSPHLARHVVANTPTAPEHELAPVGIKHEPYLTLKQLMNRQQEERKLNAHFHPPSLQNSGTAQTDIVYDEVPVRTPTEIVDCDAIAHETTCFGRRGGGGSLKRPSTGKTRHRDVPYQMIYCPLLQTGADLVQFAQNRKVQQAPTPTQYTPMTSPINTEPDVLTADERFQLDMATVTPPTVSPHHSGGKGKLTRLFGGACRHQDGTKRDKRPPTADDCQRSIRVHDSSAVSEAAPSSVQYARCNAMAQMDVQHQMLQVQYPLDVDVRSAAPSSGDYPGLEYPPIFEPETYSLADPRTISRTLLLRKHEPQK